MANQSDALLTDEANIIQNETEQNANTAERIGTMFNDIIDSKVNNDRVSDNESLGLDATLVPTQRAVKVYADTKEPLIGYIPENESNKSADGTLSDNSDTLYPTQKAVKTYADGLVVGLLKDRGNYTPSISSPGAYPSSGGSGGGGAIQKGDLWFISSNGFLGTTAVVTGSSVRALVNTPGSSTDADWDILDAGLGYIPENVDNKSTDDSLGNENPSNTFYPTQKAVKDYVDNAIANQMPYKSFVVNLSWDGATWSINDTYYNNLGGNVTLSSIGGTRLRLTTSGLFALGKTVVIPFLISQQPLIIGTLDASTFTPTLNDIYIRLNNVNGSLVTPNSFGVGSYILEVRVYN